ncbi:MAG: hypothetical protein JOY64_19665 [Alphaproteobacteria bacterium]|nr:hypothetical protein [Alphaproteobacteria bacterium]MBV8409856.1 hypothetical protein [Alphaproteobacteria bacterium]
MTTVPPAPSWTVVSVLQRSYEIAKENFAAFVTITLIASAVSVVAELLGLLLLVWAVGIVAGAASTICITWGTLQAMDGRRPGWEPMLRQLQGPLAGRLLLLGVVQWIVISVSSLLLLIPPLFLLPMWAVTIPAMMVERLEMGAAFQRSIDLTRDRRLPILGAFVLWFVLFAVGAAVLIALLGHGGLGRFVMLVYGALAWTVLYPLPAIFYVLLREEKEGTSVPEIAAALDEGTAP